MYRATLPLLVLLAASGCTEVNGIGYDASRILPPRDAGSDAAIDASASKDASPVDGGTGDAGTMDSGPTDSGPTDAGPTDAGPTDAGLRDAGEMDSSVPPSDGAVDASPPTDSGPVDAGACSAGDAGLWWADCMTDDDCDPCGPSFCAIQPGNEMGFCTRDNCIDAGHICPPGETSCFDTRNFDPSDPTLPNFCVPFGS